MAGPPRIAVLISGGGRTLENLVERSRSGAMPGEVVLALSSDPRAFGVERAQRLRVPVEVVERRAHRDVDAFSRAVWERVEAARADLACLGGFVHLVRIPERWRGRVLNIHPALIPAFSGKGFWGERVHRAVLDSGVKVSGCTVHFCDDEYDHGPIVIQKVVPVRDGDTVDSLAARVFEAEKEAYPEAIRLFAEGKLTSPPAGRS